MLQLKDVCLAFGSHQLLDHASLSIAPGDRIALLGRNGAGKSTLMKLIAGDIPLDEGERVLQQGRVIASLPQALPERTELSVFDYVATALGEQTELLRRFHELAANADSEQAMNELGEVQQQIDAQDSWHLDQRIEDVLTRCELDGTQTMASLSGGWRRRAALARALVQQPDLLLLDEPTNHLDIPTIEWLEKLLRGFDGAICFVTHDRAFLRRMANCIVELDRGQLSRWPGDYDRYMSEREHRLEVEAQQNAEFDKQLAAEERWIRQGIKARRTRNEGRVRALKAMRAERAQRRELTGKADFAIQQADASGKRVLEATEISATQGNWQLQPLSLKLMRGDKLAIIGPNGCGKSSLIRLLLGEMQPDAGELRMGSNVQIAYFDQLRESLRADTTPLDYVGQGREFIDVNGKQLHVISYLADFLFEPQQVRAPIQKLSGGESNRLMLAKLFSQPANLLVLDEPTNDLDMETLDLLCERIIDFKGTVILVSHDRDFIDQTVTSVLAFEGPGLVREYVGGYEDWLRQGGSFTRQAEDANPNASKSASEPDAAQAASNQAATSKARKKSSLTYAEQLELDKLPATIEALEADLDAAQAVIADPNFYQGDQANVDAGLKAVQVAQDELEAAMERWEALEEKAKAE